MGWEGSRHQETRTRISHDKHKKEWSNLSILVTWKLLWSSLYLPLWLITMNFLRWDMHWKRKRVFQHNSSTVFQGLYFIDMRILSFLSVITFTLLTKDKSVVFGQWCPIRHQLLCISAHKLTSNVQFHLLSYLSSLMCFLLDPMVRLFRYTKIWDVVSR